MAVMTRYSTEADVMRYSAGTDVTRRRETGIDTGTSADTAASIPTPCAEATADAMA